jgi:hypothetical protein
LKPGNSRPDPTHIYFYRDHKKRIVGVGVYLAFIPEGYQKVSGLFLCLDRGKRSQIRDFFIKRYLKQTSLIEGKAMITVTNINFYDIKGYGT